MSTQDGTGWAAPTNSRPQPAPPPVSSLPPHAPLPAQAPQPQPHTSHAPQTSHVPQAPPPPPGAWWPEQDWRFPAPPPPGSTNPWAVAALVAGLLALVPVAVVAGVVGLVQTGRRPQAGRWLAVGGLVAAATWTVVLCVVAAVFLDDLEPRLGRVGDVRSTVVGTCLTAPAAGATAWASSDCSEPHDGEVYLVEDLGAGAWPGKGEIGGRAEDACYGAFSAYVGRSWMTSDYDYGWFSPDAREWSSGERRVVCVVVPYEDSVLPRSVRGSGD